MQKGSEATGQGVPQFALTLINNYSDAQILEVCQRRRIAYFALDADDAKSSCMCVYVCVCVCACVCACVRVRACVYTSLVRTLSFFVLVVAVAAVCGGCCLSLVTTGTYGHGALRLSGSHFLL